MRDKKIEKMFLKYITELLPEDRLKVIKKLTKKLTKKDEEYSPGGKYKCERKQVPFVPVEKRSMLNEGRLHR